MRPGFRLLVDLRVSMDFGSEEKAAIFPAVEALVLMKMTSEGSLCWKRGVQLD